VIDELRGEDLVEGVDVPRTPEFPEEVVEASDNSLVLFRHTALPPFLSF
jgi:hypothetical protein